MLKATLIAILLCSVADAIAFQGYYRVKTFQSAAEFVVSVGDMDWGGFLT